MRMTLAFVSLFAVALCSCRSLDTLNIVNGTTDGNSQFSPWTVTFINGACSTANINCSGTLLSPQWVLTAAHCISSGAVGATTTATLGDQSTFCAQSLRVTSFPTYPCYTGTAPSPNNYDIALVQLGGSFKVDQSLLPTLTTGGASSGALVTFAGRGAQTEAGSDGRLYSVALQVHDTSICQGEFGSQFTSDMQCAGNTAAGVGWGDSGGPVIIPNGSGTQSWLLIGVTSFGGPLQTPPTDSVYTEITPPFSQWITGTMGGSPPSVPCN